MLAAKHSIAAEDVCNPRNLLLSCIYQQRLTLNRFTQRPICSQHPHIAQLAAIAQSRFYRHGLFLNQGPAVLLHSAFKVLREDYELTVKNPLKITIGGQRVCTCLHEVSRTRDGRLSSNINLT